MQEMDIKVAICVFVLTALMDALHAIYTRSVAQHRALSAATFGSAIYLISAFAVLQYTQNPWYLGFVVSGSWVGTFLSVKFGKRE